jgi:hypothetical protein
MPRLWRIILAVNVATALCVSLLTGWGEWILWVGPLWCLVAPLIIGLYPGEKTIARLRRARFVSRRVRPVRVLHPRVADVVVVSIERRTPASRRGPPRLAVAAL